MIEVEGGRETVLVDKPVASAWSDGAGGLLFSYHWLSEVSGIWRVPTGAGEPIVPVPSYQGGYSVIALDSCAAVVRFDDFEDRRCEEGSIGVYDPETGAHEGFAVCFREGDTGWFPGTYGGGLFAGVRWADLGSCGTDSGILFWDRSGAEIDVVANPYPLHDWDAVADWIPCELDARLSGADGRLLAYRFGPDNKWPRPEYDDVPYEAWLDKSRRISAVVVVLDLGTGAQIFRADSEAEERLADFDGRLLVLNTADRRDDVPLGQLRRVVVRTIVDITGESPEHIVDGLARLTWTGN